MGVGSRVTFLFLAIIKSHFSTCYKSSCPYKDYTNARFEAFRKVQSYNMTDISQESEERKKKKKEKKKKPHTASNGALTSI